MDQYDADSAPGMWSVLKFIAKRVRSFKWLIGGATLVVAALFLAVERSPPPAEIWTGKTKVTIGVAPPVSFVLQRTGSPLAPLEAPRQLVARISAQAFKEKVARRAAFDPKKADLSRGLVISSLRGAVLDSDREIAVDLSAASPGDVRAATTALAAELGEAHGALLERYLQPVRAQIEDAKARLALIENANEALNERLLSAKSGDTSGPVMAGPSVTPTLPAWTELKDRIQLNENLTELSEPTVVWPEPALSSIASRADGSLRQSLAAGLVMLVAIFLLTLALGKS